MKFLFLFFVISFYSFALKAQNNDKIIQFFKLHEVDSIVNYCAFPFDLSAGSMLDDNAIKDPRVLKSKLQQLFREHYFNTFLKGRK